MSVVTKAYCARPNKELELDLDTCLGCDLHHLIWLNFNSKYFMQNYVRQIYPEC